MQYCCAFIALSFISGCVENLAPRPRSLSVNIAAVEKPQTKSTRKMRVREFPRNRELSVVDDFVCPKIKPAHWTDVWFSVCHKLLQENEEIISRDSASATSQFPHLLDQKFEDLHGSKYELEPGRIGESVLVYQGLRRNHPPAIFKYQLNCAYILLNSKCESRDKLSPRCLRQLDEDSLKQEFLFSNIINSLSVTKVCPQVFSLSPPVDIPSSESKADKFLLLETRKQECISIGSSIRLIVEEQVGSMIDVCLKTEPITDRKNLLRFAIKSFIQTIKLLHEIHTIGIIHGDIHFGNIGWRDSGDSCDYENPEKLLLIDFGMSEFFPPDIGKQEKASPGLYATVNPVFLSPFELAGFRRGRRDDVYRAFQNMIHLLSNEKLLQIYAIARHHMRIMDHGRFLQLKITLDITTDSSDTNRFSRIFPTLDPRNYSKLVSAVNDYRSFFDAEPILALKSVFDDMHTYLTGRDPTRPLLSPDSEPDYDWLINQAEHILNSIPFYLVFEISSFHASRSFLMLIVLFAGLVLFCGCGGRRSGSRKSNSSTGSMQLRFIPTADSESSIRVPAYVAPAVVNRIVDPHVLREYFFLREGPGRVEPSECTAPHSTEWTSEWIATCARIEAEKRILRQNDVSSTNLEFPNLSDPGTERFGNGGPVETFRLTLLHKANQCVIFSGLSDSSSAIFKYQVNCREMKKNHDCDSKWNEETFSDPSCYIQDNEDPLLSEYVITRIVASVSSPESKTCPNVFALSPPVVIPREMNPKTDMKYLTAGRGRVGQCRRMNSAIRLLVEERIGLSLEICLMPNQRRRITDVDLFRFATNAFIRIVSLIHQIHTLGFIHGDIHLGNVGFTKPHSNLHHGCPFTDPNQLILMDFGFAHFFPIEIGKRNFIGPGLYYPANEILLSPFELAGYRRGRRDDIYRAFEMFIDMLAEGSLLGLYDAFNKGVGVNVRHDEMAKLKFGLSITTDESGNPSRIETLFPDGTRFSPPREEAIINYSGLMEKRGLFHDSAWPAVHAIFANMEEYVKGRTRRSYSAFTSGEDGIANTKHLVSPDSEPDYDWLISQANRILQYIP